MESDCVDLIIVNYNSTEYLLKCLESAYQSSADIILNVHIQDNSTQDNTRCILKQFPQVHLKKNVKNIGFSAAVNAALTQSSAPFVVILNPDSLIKKDFFQSALQYMKDNPDVGLLGPKILNPDNTVQGSARAYPTPVTGFFGRASLLSKWFPNNIITRKNILTQKDGGKSPFDVDWVSGACMVARRKAIDDVGPMDERFFMYFEDVDWCRRMWEKHWKIVYYPFASVVHHVGGSSNKRPFRSKLDFHKSCYRYFIKYPYWPLIVSKFVFSVALSIRFLFLMIFDVFHWLQEPPENNRPKILFFISEDWFFVSHFMSRALAALKNGYDVIVVTNVNRHKKIIEQNGITVFPLRLKRKSKNIFHELNHIIRLYKILKKEKPDIIHNIAIKPMIYGSMAALFTKTPFVLNAVVGLGAIFIKKGQKARAIQILVLYIYKFLFHATKSRVIFENDDDIEMFLNGKVINKEQVVLIKGAGVDTHQYKYTQEPDGIPLIVLVSRMLWDKGVGEYVNAAKQLKHEGLQCRFVLVGGPDPENPESIPLASLNRWNSENIIEWWGHREDIPEIFAKSNIVVLPSYREGLPKVLLEAASCGRPIVSTDVPGCRVIVRNNENGILVPPYDSKSLANAIKILVQDSDLRKRMGLKGREIVENEFAEKIVVTQTMDLYKTLLSGNPYACNKQFVTVF